MSSVLSGWAEKDQSAAVAWARQQTDPKLSDLIWPQLIQGLASNDPQGAVAQSLPDGETKIRQFRVTLFGFL